MNESENVELGKLIKAIAEGDRNAIGEIFQRVGGAMKAVARSYLLSEADAEDVVQDCLLTIVRKADKFRENKNAKAWINTIVKNLAKNKLKCYKRRMESPLEIAQGIAVELDESSLTVYEILIQLSQREKDLIIYRYWYQSPLSDIAAIMHCSKSTLSYRLEKLEEKIRNFSK